MKSRIILALSLSGILLLSSSVLAGSYGPYFYNDGQGDDFGESFRAQRDNQIINLNAGMDQEPVEGLSGQAAADVISSYHKSFAPRTGGPAATNIINIGAGGLDVGRQQ